MSPTPDDEAAARARTDTACKLESGDWAATFEPDRPPTLYRIESFGRTSPSGVPGVERVAYKARRVSLLPDGSLNYSIWRISLDSRKIVAVGNVARALCGLEPIKERKKRKRRPSFR